MNYPFRFISFWCDPVCQSDVRNYQIITHLSPDQTMKSRSLKKIRYAGDVLIFKKDAIIDRRRISDTMSSHENGKQFMYSDRSQRARGIGTPSRKWSNFGQKDKNVWAYASW